MSDSLAVINRVIEEHQAIKQHVKLVGDTVSDQEALSSLGKARADWIPGRLELLSEKQKRLQQTMSALDEGLKNHFAFEEKALPPLLGTLLMRALVMEHKEIKEEIGKAKSAVASIKLEGLSRDQLLAQDGQIQQVVADLCQLVEEHASREELILAMIKRALEGK
jgi:hemerythrin